MAIRVQIWNVQADKDSLNQLANVRLAQPIFQNRIQVVHDGLCPPGENLARWRRHQSVGVGVFILLISPEFLASDVLISAIAEIDQGPRGMPIVPIVVRACSLKGTFLESTQTLPRGLQVVGDTTRPKAISDFSPANLGWLEVENGLHGILDPKLEQQVVLHSRSPEFQTADDYLDDPSHEPDSVVEEPMQQQQKPAEATQKWCALQPGMRIQGQFAILRAASRRGGTAVMSAWDTQQQRAVQLHVVHPNVKSKDAVWNRVEARLAQWDDLKSRSIVRRLSSSASTSDLTFFVSELNQEPTLLDLLLREALPPAARLPIAIALANEVLRLHEADEFVHGNIRPQEVFLHADGRIRIGSPHMLAGVDLDSVDVSSLGLNLASWAPELRRPSTLKLASKQADVYGVALVTAVVLSGTFPSAQQLAMPAMLVQSLRDVHPTLKDILLSALSQEPANRPASVRDLTHQLVQQYQNRHDRTTVEMVNVPGNTIRMVWDLAGKPLPEGKKRSAQKAIVSTFQLGKYPVTQAQFESVMGANRSHYKAPDHPITNVTFHDAVEFCNRLSLLEGYTEVYAYTGGLLRCNWDADGYRLPTEAEWELAARGTSGRRFAFAGDGPLGDRVAWSGEGNGAEPGRTETSPVRAHPRGATPPQSDEPDSSIWDLTGNVWEWCWDYLGSFAGFEHENEKEVTDPRGPLQPEPGRVPAPIPGARNRVLKGGSFRDTREEWMHASARNADDEHAVEPVNGFRVARSIRT
ncbi:MAG: SUMF1/EgtB/PvdO family nonheme iron enzyme [Polyangiaceae bacterium]|nr:SUMF1/EgtB/PvdO family nonheme iron enzyme [Polyangiaceae bacterium]